MGSLLIVFGIANGSVLEGCAVTVALQIEFNGADAAGDVDHQGQFQSDIGSVDGATQGGDGQGGGGKTGPRFPSTTRKALRHNDLHAFALQHRVHG